MDGNASGVGDRGDAGEVGGHAAVRWTHEHDESGVRMLVKRLGDCSRRDTEADVELRMETRRR